MKDTSLVCLPACLSLNMCLRERHCLSVYAVSHWLLFSWKPTLCQNNPITHLMATCCRLCFVRLDRCCDEPSGAITDMLQAFVVTRRYEDAHTKFAQKFPQIFSCCSREMPKTELLRDNPPPNLLHISMLFLSVRSLDEFFGSEGAILIWDQMSVIL